MNTLPVPENSPHIYLADETFAWAFEEGITFTANPNDVHRTIEVAAPAGGYDAGLIATRGVMLILRGQKELQLGAPNVDGYWDSRPDGKPFYHADELFKPDRKQTQPTLKRDLRPLAERSARFEFVVDEWDNNLDRKFLEQLMTRRVHGNVVQIIGQELLGALSDSFGGRHNRRMRAARKVFREEGLVPFNVGTIPRE